MVNYNISVSIVATLTMLLMKFSYGSSYLLRNNKFNNNHSHMVMGLKVGNLRPFSSHQDSSFVMNDKIEENESKLISMSIGNEFICHVGILSIIVSLMILLAYFYCSYHNMYRKEQNTTDSTEKMPSICLDGNGIDDSIIINDYWEKYTESVIRIENNQFNQFFNEFQEKKL